MPPPPPETEKYNILCMIYEIYDISMFPFNMIKRFYSTQD